MRGIFAALFLLVALATAVHCLDEHHCMHDELTTRQQRASLLDPVRVELVASNRSASLFRASTAFAAIRIAAFFDNLDDGSKYCTSSGQTITDLQDGAVRCTKENVLTASKKNYLIDTIVKEAIQLHAERLLVRPEGRVVVNRTVMSFNGVCSQFSYPPSHATSGYDADFLLYVSAAPTTSAVAWAATCQRSTTSGRPLVGVINVSPRYITEGSYPVRVVAHEIMHALGFAKHFFKKRAMVFREKAPSYGVKSSRALAAAREFYDYPRLSAVELEDQGNSGTAGSHWKRRNAKDDLMSGIIGVGRYSAMSIAVMEDLGYYQGRYDKAEPMSWGYHAGYPLLESKCVINGVSRIEDMFCMNIKPMNSNSFMCPSDRLGLGYCSLAYSDYCKNASSSAYSYFSDPALCGSKASALMDFCPHVMSYRNAECQNGDVKAMPGSYVTPNSRCFQSSSGLIKTVKGTTTTALCAEVQCVGNPTYAIRLSASDPWTLCTEGSTVSLSTQSTIASGSVTCPRYEDVCFSWTPVQEIRYDAAQTPSMRPVTWLSLLGIAFTFLLTV